MSEPKRAWIYARINQESKHELLTYQMKLLTDYAHENNYAIVGETPAYDSGKSLESRWMRYLTDCVISEWMDCILVYSKNRLLIDPEAYEEFEIICKMHNVSIITLN